MERLECIPFSVWESEIPLSPPLGKGGYLIAYDECGCGMEYSPLKRGDREGYYRNVAMPGITVAV